MRQFETGATRDTAEGKIDYEGFLNPLVLERFGQYMLDHQDTEKGPRPSDNWQQGMPRDVYMKSMLRHMMDVWKIHRGYDAYDKDYNQVFLDEALCAVLFNLQGYLLEYLIDRNV